MTPKEQTAKKERSKRSENTISRSFLTWLTAIVLVGFITSTGLIWLLQTQLSNQSAEQLLLINIGDVQQDILDASDENLLELTRQIWAELPEGQKASSDRLKELLTKYDVSEIHVIDENGIIVSTTTDEYLGFDMRSGAQALEFMCLIDGDETEFVQKLQPISKDSSIISKFAGKRFDSGGFLQVGYDPPRFQQDVDRTVIGLTHNWHVGRSGFILIANQNWVLVSDPFFHEGENLAVSGLWIDTETMPEKKIFLEDVYGIPCSCVYATSEGYYTVAVIPENEIVMQRDSSVVLMSALEIIVFGALLAMIFLLVRRKVVKNINEVNDSLSRITDGNLDVVVDVRDNTEFASLSDDINATVSTLKQYIAAAAARIDAELAFARSIQESALPSVFPPYPDRKEFSLYASMDTAKEVGGDFYDFYMLEENMLAFLVADVSGKGIPAAMFMMTGKTLLRDHAERGDKPAAIFRNANNKLCEGNDAEMFITAWMGFLDTDSGLVRFVNAGHNPPVLIRAGRASFIPQRANIALAAAENVNYREQTLQLQSGDLLLLYTDGVTEATDVKAELFGNDRLCEVLSRDFGTGDEACRSVCGTVKEQIDLFVGDAPQFDDITMLCLYYSGQSGPDNS